MHQPQNDHSWRWPHLICNNSDIVHQCPRTSRVGMSIFTARGCPHYSIEMFQSATHQPLLLQHSPAAMVHTPASGEWHLGKHEKKHRQAWFLNALDMLCVNLMFTCFTSCLLVVHLTIPILIDSHDTAASRGVPQLPLISKQVQVHVHDWAIQDSTPHVPSGPSWAHGSRRAYMKLGEHHVLQQMINDNVLVPCGSENSPWLPLEKRKNPGCTRPGRHGQEGREVGAFRQGPSHHDWSNSNAWPSGAPHENRRVAEW